ELLRKALDAAFGVDQLLPAGEERVAVGADFEVQVGLGRPGLPSRPARAPDLDFVVLGVKTFSHGVLLGRPGKKPLYRSGAADQPALRKPVESPIPVWPLPSVRRRSIDWVPGSRLVRSWMTI